MPKRAVRKSKRATGFLSFLIVVLALAAVGLVCAIVIQERAKPAQVDTVTEDPGGSFVDASDLPETEIVLRAASYEEPGYIKGTRDPGQALSVTPTPEPTLDPNDPNARLRPMPLGEGLLPVFSSAFTDDKVIAITLDECAGVAITTKFVELAQLYGAKLTLFPSGEYVMKAGMADVLRKCAFDLGYEIENRGYSATARIFQYPDDMMVQEIWMQSVAVSFNLGVKYEQHFFRPYGGLGEYDHRTHAYLQQQGYKGVAHWTYSCSGMDIDKLVEKLKPGGIYSFRATEADGQRMSALMQAAREQGYRMVTLNELFGYEANTWHTVTDSLLSEVMPSFSYQSSRDYDIYPGESSWDVCLIQSRLVALGYLKIDQVDGIFGEGTAEALRLFQAQLGRPASGIGDPGTLELLYADDAPANPAILTDTPAPGSGPLIEEENLVPSQTLAPDATGN